MKYVPKSVTRFASRSLLKLNKNSPTILVVGGVVGFGVTTVMVARASRNIDPVVSDHASEKRRLNQRDLSSRERGAELLRLYGGTGIQLAKIYGPSMVVGGLSAAAVLSGHKILRGRHVATMAAYSGLADQFRSYRERVSKTLGEKAEKDIYNGAHGEWVEDENHKGEYKLQPKFEESPDAKDFCRPFFDEVNVHWTKDPESNYFFLKGVQSHMNTLLNVRGHVFLNEVLDALRMERVPEGQVTGWVLDNPNGDGYIDFGFMTGDDPQSIAFRNKAERSVRLNFNIDGVIWELI